MNITKCGLATWLTAALVAGAVSAYCAYSVRRSAAQTPAVDAGGAAAKAAPPPSEPEGLVAEPKCVVPPGVRQVPIRYWRTFGEIGDVPCTERSGRAMRTSELRGKFVVADCIFTSCAGVCPAMSLRMEELQDAVKAMDDVRLLTIAVDPERDTTQALSAWADRYHADAERWIFLRCEPPALQELVYDRLRLARSRGDLTDHRAQLALIDTGGRVRGYYSPLADKKDDRAWLGRLLSDIDELRRRPER